MDHLGGGKLLDLQGNPTDVQISYSTGVAVQDCTYGGTTGDDDAFLDDRIFFPASFSNPEAIYLDGLAPGQYRVLLYTIGVCYTDRLLVKAHGATGNWFDPQWNGGFAVGETHEDLITQYFPGGRLSVVVEGWSYDEMRICGLQVHRLEGFTPFCFGDGDETDCPCGNEGGEGQGCANSTGIGARLQGESNDGSIGQLAIHATGLRPSQPALLVVGTLATNEGLGLGLGDGLRCAGGLVDRLGFRHADATGRATWGPGIPGASVRPGELLHFQVWYRDPSSSPCGNGFNLSSGLAVYLLK